MESFKSKLKLNDKTTMYVVFVCIGLVLIIGGSAFGDNKKETFDSVEVRLSEILTKIEGVGETDVMLNYEDEKVKGAIIVSKGADDAYIRQKIISAVSAVLGIESNKIEIFEKE